MCFIVLCCLLVGCVHSPPIQQQLDPSNEVVGLQSIKEKATFAYANYSSEEIDKTLDELAKMFAQLVNDEKSIKEFIGDQVGKKFDDDYDALFEVMADVLCKSGTMRSMLAKSAQNTGKNLHSMTKVIPYLNLAIPVHFDKWADYDGSIYVIPLQYSKDDLQITELIGYDGEGNSIVFDTQNPPEIPVLVLGINERIEYFEQKQEALKQKILNREVTTLGLTDGPVIHTEIL